MASSSAGAVGGAAYGGDKKDKILVAALDIGTTHSVYAYSFKVGNNTDPSKVSTNPNWAAGCMPLLSLKTPTCVLFDENQEFHSFGFEAENNFEELALDEEHVKWYFFKRFKMSLYGRKTYRDMEIEDVFGRKMPAIKVFGEAIRYLKNHLLKFIKAQGIKIENKDIHWVLTVPAIWSDSEKQFMGEAAYQAGIHGGQLSIVPEPVAALQYCYNSAKIAVAAPGSKYMVIDLGGDTADITVHERQTDGSLREMHKPDGGPWGGTKVDADFFQLMIKIIGAPVFKEFKEKCTADFLDLQRELETKKRTITSSTSGKITIKVPVSIAEEFEEYTEKPFKDAIENSPYKDKITWRADKLRMDADLFKGMFKDCADIIVSKVKYLLNEPKVKGTNMFFMVGGFSESVLIQEHMISAFPDCKIVIPEEAGLVVLKGAVIFGHNQIAITPRVKVQESCKRYRAYLDFL